MSAYRGRPASDGTAPYRESLVGDLLLRDVLGALAAERPVFHSEADFQHHLAWCVRQLDPSVQVRMETRPVPDLSLELDLLLVHPPSGERVAVELKYSTRMLAVEHDGEPFRLRNQAAQDVRRHDFIKDLVRLETLVARRAAHRGWAIFLTNDQGFWQASGRMTVDTAFRLHEGRVLHSDLAWSETAGAGTRQGRDEPLQLTDSYPLHWTDFSTVAPGPAGSFRLLAVAVGPDSPSAQPIHPAAARVEEPRPVEVASPPAATPTVERPAGPEAADLRRMVDELRRLRSRCEPKDTSNPVYQRYSQAVSALNWIADHSGE